MSARRTLSRHAPRHLPRRARGLTLIELLVGLTISSLIIVGTVFVYSQSRTTYALNDRAARLQEYGRFALSVIEPDLQLAGYYGFSNNSTDLRYMNGASEVPTSQLEQEDTQIIASPVAIHTCGNNFALDLIATVQGTENAYLTSATGCQPPASFSWQAGSDTLTVRRASTAAVAATKTKLQLYVNELKRSNQFIFNSDTAPGPLDTLREVHDLVLHSYYVSDKSDGSTTTPSLRRKVLSTDGTDPQIIDEEVLPNVEDMQVQFGIDTGDHNGVAGIDVDEDKNGIPDNPNGLISRYVNADDALLKTPAKGGVQAQVVAVRIWLRIRADDKEPGFVDTRNYEYADIKYTPAAADAGYRRIVISRTIFLRNARTL
jgi:type IV pilus assembly protein PilW